jgi:hypothetical protein
MGFESLTLDDTGMTLLRRLMEDNGNQPSRDTNILARELSEHIYLLDQNRDISLIKNLDWRIEVDPRTVMFAYAVHNGYQQVGSEFITHILSQYHVALQRQNKKIAWLRTHPNGDQR